MHLFLSIKFNKLKKKFWNDTAIIHHAVLEQLHDPMVFPHVSLQTILSPIFSLQKQQQQQQKSFVDQLLDWMLYVC